MYQTKRFGLVASKQEYMMLCRAERHLKQKKKLTGQHLPAFKVHKNKAERTRKELSKKNESSKRKYSRC